MITSPPGATPKLPSYGADNWPGESQLLKPRPSVLVLLLRYIPPFLLCFLSIASYACVLALVLLPAAGLGAPLGRELAPSADEVGPTAAMLLLCAYDLVCALAVISFVKAARIAPGAIPLWLCSREPGDQAYFHNVLQAVEKKADGQSLRFCRECGAFKPDRCHHCAELGQCVLAMQHWSPLCNNAIGYYNLKPYLLWLLYASLAHALALAALAPGLLRAADPLLAARGAPVVVALRDGGEGSVLAYALVSALTSALVGGAIFFWLVCHAVLAARGVTAAETGRQCGCSRRKRPKPPLPANPFDFGVRANFVKVRSCAARRPPACRTLSPARARLPFRSSASTRSCGCCRPTRGSRATASSTSSASRAKPGRAKNYGSQIGKL